jgi:predicted RNase H-like nuclease (RuvC/YqgF family)
LLQTQQLEEQKDSEMDKDKKIKQLEELVKELQEENDMLWDYLDEVRESEKALMKEIQIAVDDYVIKQMKPIGDA